MKIFKWVLVLLVLVGVGFGAYQYHKGTLAKYGSEGTFESTVGLLDPQTDKPLPNTPFYLVIVKDTEIDPAFKKPLFGITDDQGRAAHIVSRTQLTPSDYVLVQRVGSGEYGKYFALLGAGNAIPVPKGNYTLSGCPDTPEYNGISNKQGYTVFYASKQPCNVKLSIDWSSTLNNLLK